MNKNLLYRSIPKVDIILEYEVIQASIEKYGREIVVDAIRVEMDELRKFIGTCDSEEAAKEAIANVVSAIVKRAENMLQPNMRR